eukprot:1181015-Prorocentrum_minimum.AAC.4
MAAIAQTIRAPIVARVHNVEKQSAARVLTPKAFARSARCAHVMCAHDTCRGTDVASELMRCAPITMTLLYIHAFLVPVTTCVLNRGI